jgi:hypothetical protein
MSTLREKIAVMEAYGRGEEVEWRVKADNVWNRTIVPAWDWKEYDYRVKPKVTLCSNVRMDLEKVEGQPFATRYTVTCDCGFVDRTTCRHCADAWYEEHVFVAKMNRKPTHLRPWTPMEAVGKVVMGKKTGKVRMIVGAEDELNYRFGIGEFSLTWAELTESYQQPDGSPCGVEE